MAIGRCNARWPGALGVLLSLTLLLSGNIARAQNPIISDIQIEGNQRVESDAIRLHISQRTGEPLNNAAVSDDIKSIYKMGFFQNVTADTRNEKGKEVLVYKVTERPQVTDVKITGMKEVRTTDDKIVAAMKIHPGSILDPTRVKETEKEIKEVYEGKGFSDTKVDYQEQFGANNTEVGTFVVTEGPKVYIREVDFTGNHAFSARELRGQMDTTKYIPLLSLVTTVGVLDQKKLREDTDRIAAFYYDHGYLNVHVGEPVISRIPKGLKVTIPIDEGPIYKVGSVDVAGDLKYPRSELVPLITIKPGADFRGSTLQHDVLTLSDFYSDRGYAFVDVEPKTALEPAARKVNITFSVNPGREVLVNRINISGNTRTSDKVIRREMQVQEQEPYSASAIRDSKRRLDQLGFFSTTRITTAALRAAGQGRSQCQCSRAKHRLISGRRRFRQLSVGVRAFPARQYQSVRRRRGGATERADRLPVPKLYCELYRALVPRYSAGGVAVDLRQQNRPLHFPSKCGRRRDQFQLPAGRAGL